jgi:3-hydroxyisobutyrate dehydrogenase-like beta-hydroxyacid dehydrogenase
MIVAGPRELFDEARGGLAAMTARLEHVGERADLAAAYKLFGNALIVTITAGLADVFAMAGNLGIEPRDAHRLFSWFNAGATVGYRGGAMAKGDYTASFELAMARKDVRLMVEAAEGSGVPLAVLPAVAARMDALLARGLGARDLGALAVDAVPEGSG